MTKILITPKSYYEIREQMEPLLQGMQVVFNHTGRTLTEAEMAERIGDVDGLIVGIDPVTRQVIESAGYLRAISKYGVGIDNIDLDAVRKHRIALKTAPGTNAVSVAELTLALILAMSRHLWTSARSVKKGEWKRNQGVELSGKTLGLIGCGHIGREVARRAGCLSMSVIICDPYFHDPGFLAQHDVETVSLDELIDCADFISLHLPLTAETRAIIGRRQLERMKPGAYLINTARGELVDEAALLSTLRSGGIAGAACDVLSNEPPGSHPLLELDNFMLTPHIGGHTREAVLRMAHTATANLIEMLQGR